VLAGWFGDVEAALEPFIWFKYSAPTIAFYPLFVAWLGYSRPTVVAIGALFALTPIYATTLSGIKNVDRDLVRAAHSFGARPLDIFLRVALPGSVPIVVAGPRVRGRRAHTGGGGGGPAARGRSRADRGRAGRVVRGRRRPRRQHRLSRATLADDADDGVDCG